MSFYRFAQILLPLHPALFLAFLCMFFLSAGCLRVHAALPYVDEAALLPCLLRLHAVVMGFRMLASNCLVAVAVLLLMHVEGGLGLWVVVEAI
jgi:hypothetical protein